MTKLFDTEIKKSGNRACEYLKELGEHLSQNNRPMLTVSKHIKIAFAAIATGVIGLTHNACQPAQQDINA